MIRRLAAVLLVASLLLVAVVSALPVAAQSAGPQGHTPAPEDNFGVGNGQGQGGPPSNANIPTHAAAWDIHSSRHADDLQTVVDADRQGRLILSLTDDVNHDGREIAVSREALKSSLGHEPEMAYGLHEDGTKWTKEIDYQGEYAVFEVDKFSTNDVTFNGTVELTGNAASDGTTYSYNLSNDTGVDNFEVDLTGSLKTESASNSGSADDGSTKGVSIGGTQDPENGEISVSGSTNSQKTTTQFESISSSDPSGTSREISISTSNIDTIETVKLRGESYYNSEDLDLEVQVDGVSFGQINWPADTLTTKTYSDGSVDVGSSATVTIIKRSDDGAFRQIDDHDTYTEVISGKPSNIEVSADTGDTVSLGNGGTAAIDLTKDTSSLSFSADGSGSMSWTLSRDEITETTDPSISVNGNEEGYTGTLADGETVSLSVDESWLQTGENNVAVSTGSDSVVDMNYSHDANGVVESTNVESTTWEEYREASRTFESDQSDVTVSTEFSPNVVDVSNVSYRVNEGSWQTPSYYQITDGSLEADIGDVQSGDAVDLQMTARKVHVIDGEIDITDPTLDGNKLNTEFEIVDRGSDFGIDVTKTDPAGLAHYLTERSWTGDPDYSEFSADGTQLMRLPDAPTGGVARVSTAPLGVAVGDGMAGLVVTDAAEPEFRVIDDGIDDRADWVDLTYTDASPDRSYELYSITNERTVVTGDEQNGEVTLRTDASAQTYIIQPYSGSGGGGGGAVSITQSSAAGPFSIVALFAGIGGSVFGTVYLGRRFGFKSATSNSLLLVVGSIVGFVAVELATERDILSDLLFAGGSAFSDALSTLFATGAGSVITGLLILLSVYLIDSRTRLPIPKWFYIISGVFTAVWTIDAISGGALTATLDELGPLLWIILLIGGGALLWRALQPTIIEISGRQS